MRQLTMETYIKHAQARYANAKRRKTKALILDDFCAMTGYTRKHAITILKHKIIGWHEKPLGRKKSYEPELLLMPLKQIWFATNQMCGKRLREAMPLWLPHYDEACGKLDETIKQQLLLMSSATIDRLLQPLRVRYPKRLGGTKPGYLLKHQIPIKTDQWNEDRPGFVEGDTVAHCGTSLRGNFVWSITVTDVYSGWTENAAMWNKGAYEAKKQIQSIEVLNFFIVDMPFDQLKNNIYILFLNSPHFEFEFDTFQVLFDKYCLYARNQSDGNKLLLDFISHPKVEATLLANEDKLIKLVLAKDYQNSWLISHIKTIKLKAKNIALDPSDSLAHLAVRDGDKPLLRLLQSRLDSFYKNAVGESYLDIACQLNQFELLEQINNDKTVIAHIKKQNVLLYADYLRDKHAGLELFAALKDRNYLLFQCLLRVGSDITARTQDNETILDIILKTGATDYLQRLFTYTPDVFNILTHNQLAKTLLSAYVDITLSPSLNRDYIIKTILVAQQQNPIPFYHFFNQLSAVSDNLLNEENKYKILLQYIHRYIKMATSPEVIIDFVEQVKQHAPQLFIRKNRALSLFKQNNIGKLISTTGLNIYNMANVRMVELAKDSSQIYTAINNNKYGSRAFIESKYNSNVMKLSSNFAAIFVDLHKPTAVTKLKNEQAKIESWMKKKLS